MEKKDADVIIIGAGISGLSCARTLMNEGINFLIVEAGDRVGGRIKSDLVDGFILDHGFQVLQTAYPEVRSQLDLDGLDLKPFAPGVAVRRNNQFFYISDPLRRPQDLWGTLTAPVGTTIDRLRMLRLFFENRIKGPRGIFESTDMKTIDFLRSYHFSDTMIEGFFRPFFAGASLDPGLNASSRVFRYLFNVFASGDAALPSRGMESVPLALSMDIPADKIRLNSRVESIDNGTITLKDGQKFTPRAIVIATEGPETERLLKTPKKSKSKGERCLYFSSEKPPIPRPFLILNGQGKGIINNIAIPTLTAPSYSSSGRDLIAVVVLEDGSIDGMDNASLQGLVRRELQSWFGDEVIGWDHIRTYNVHHGLPDQSPPLSNPTIDSFRVRDGLYTCGEYQSVPGIQWALLSGRRTAERIIQEDKLHQF